MLVRPIALLPLVVTLRLYDGVVIIVWAYSRVLSAILVGTQDERRAVLCLSLLLQLGLYNHP